MSYFKVICKLFKFVQQTSYKIKQINLGNGIQNKLDSKRYKILLLENLTSKKRADSKSSWAYFYISI